MKNLVKKSICFLLLSMAVSLYSNFTTNQSHTQSICALTPVEPPPPPISSNSIA